jgi:transcriptional regulator with XRE-family HTH domain
LIVRLVQARKDQELSQQELATQLGRHQQLVSRYELGERRLDVVEFVDVARTLKLRPSKLVELVIDLGIDNATLDMLIHKLSCLF